MRNVIVFINICILALVTKLAIDTKQEASATSLTGSVNSKESALEVKSSTNTALASNVNADAVGRRITKSLAEKEEYIVKEFILTMNQERLLDREQSLLAVQRGTQRSLKDYGSWMALHQQRMLDDLKKMARRRGLSTTPTLDPSGKDELAEIQKLHDKRFDTRYIKVTIASLKNDLKQFERASYSPDPEVQVFATRYMTVTRDNLAKLQQIRKSYR